jgi:diguanylate cyclase (GGDEF)-like protein
MNHAGSGKLDYATRDRFADQRAIDSTWSDSSADQGAEDSDQTASDQDQAGSEVDEAAAVSDQRAADRDQASADRLHVVDLGGVESEAFEGSRQARKESTVSRLATHIARARTARSRAVTSDERDAIAAGRDETARRRDADAQAIERAIAASDASLAEKLEWVRIRAAADRARAAADRRRAAQDRADAARERARLEAELHSAHLDDLTGAFRRDMGTAALSREIDRARRADGRFVIAFVDVDGLKRVNDRDGHAAGDHLLQVLVQTMRSNLRSFDPIVRYGGDEFLCGLGGVDLDEVERRFIAIDRSVGEDVGFGISVGLAALAADETLDELEARADADLLAAKSRRGE